MSGVPTKNFSPLDQLEHPPLATPFSIGGRQREIPANLQSGHISAPVQELRKLKALYFLQLLKFEKTKCPYFLQFLLRGWDIAIFLIRGWHLVDVVDRKGEKGCISVPDKQGLRWTRKLQQSTNWKVNLRIYKLAKASKIENWSFKLVCLADPFS